GGDIHFDVEGLTREELAARAPAKSVILMLQPCAGGGGLRLWDLLYDGADSVDEPDWIPSRIVDYAVGDLAIIDSYRLHQIQPFEGAVDRISATAHLVLSGGRWQAWF